MALCCGAQDASTVLLFHQRAGLQVFALVPGTGSWRICAPLLLTSLRPVLVPVTKPMPEGVGLDYPIWPGWWSLPSWDHP